MVAESAIQEATRRLVDQFHPARIILFGSQARGAAREDSDIDLIVLCDTIANRNALEARMLVAMRGISVSIDILAYTPGEFEQESKSVGSVLHPAAREGKVVYDRAA